MVFLIFVLNEMKLNIIINKCELVNWIIFVSFFKNRIYSRNVKFCVFLGLLWVNNGVDMVVCIIFVFLGVFFGV